eukprot:GHVU01130636.1.p1 GENE.GHVU01130636.1~~GHVU01130636.1.p1  ORF type:complete len:166 (-),score=17.85 GHVU01130636.1:929-1426(-)
MRHIQPMSAFDEMLLPNAHTHTQHGSQPYRRCFRSDGCHRSRSRWGRSAAFVPSFLLSLLLTFLVSSCDFLGGIFETDLPAEAADILRPGRSHILDATVIDASPHCNRGKGRDSERGIDREGGRDRDTGVKGGSEGKGAREIGVYGQRKRLLREKDSRDNRKGPY